MEVKWSSLNNVVFGCISCHGFEDIHRVAVGDIARAVKDYWRAVILYGENQSISKMALVQCLIQYPMQN